MVFVSIGGMQLKKNWLGYFRIIGPTFKVLRAAKRDPNCVSADIFRSGKVYFALSVWRDRDSMVAFGRSGLHGQLTGVAMAHMAMFYNHSAPFDAVPTRDAAVEAWTAAMAERGGRGTVGRLAE